ncbi:MAG: RDD family protein [Candidatus Paceibacterota bacterium]
MFCKYCGKENINEAKFCKYCGEVLSANSVVPENPSAEDTYAGFWLRVGAFILDYGLMLIIAIILVFSFSLTWSTESDTIVGFIILVVYHTLFLSIFSSTPGKKLYGLLVIDATTKGNIKFGKAFVRSLSYVLSSLIFGAGFWTIAFNKINKQGWHDKIAKTLVIRKKKKSLILPIILSAVSVILIAAFIYLTDNLNQPLSLDQILDQILTEGQISSNNQLGKNSAVVNVFCDNNNGGSGTIFSTDGFVLTNNHVISGAISCKITIPDSKGAISKVYIAEPLIIPDLSEKYDIAGLTITGSYTDSKGKTWGDYPTVFPAFTDPTDCINNDNQLGDSLIIYGYPITSGGVNLTVTKGNISSFSDDGSILTDAQIDSGNSGGLAVNQYGCFVGIPSAVLFGDYQNLGVIISTDIIDEFLNEIESEPSSDLNPLEKSNNKNPITTCPGGKIWNSTQTKCVTQLEYCIEENGQHAIYNSSDNSCGCEIGYVYSSISNKCISRNASCNESYSNSEWSGTYDGETMICDCKTGYVWNFDQTVCVTKISIDQICQTKYGYSSYYLGYVENGSYMCH